MIHMINNVKLLNIPDRYFMTVYRSIKNKLSEDCKRFIGFAGANSYQYRQLEDLSKRFVDEKRKT